MLCLHLGPDFAATWSGRPGRKYQSKKEQLKQKVGSFAHEIHSKYFKEAALGSYGAMGKLRDISTALDNACKNSRVCFQIRPSFSHKAGCRIPSFLS